MKSLDVNSGRFIMNPTAKDLYEKLKLVGNLKVESTTYKLSDFAGKTFLQKWPAWSLS